MQRHRIDGEGFRLLFARPFEPRGTVFQGVGEDFDFVVGESVLCLFEEFGEFVGCLRFRRIGGRAAGGGCRRIRALEFRAAPRGRRCQREGCFFGWRVVAVVLDFGGLGRAVVLCHG